MKKQTFKSKSFAVALLTVISGFAIFYFSPENKEIGISMITSGMGLFTLRDAINK